MVSKNTICLWYDRSAEDAASSTLQPSNSKVSAVRRAPPTSPAARKAMSWWSSSPWPASPASASMAEPAFKHSEAFSFQIATDDQAETDRLWNAIVRNGGQGERVRLVQGQVGPVLADHPARPHRRDGDPDPAVNKRVFEAMMEMKKIDVAAIEAARRG